MSKNNDAKQATPKWCSKHLGWKLIHEDSARGHFGGYFALLAIDGSGNLWTTNGDSSILIKEQASRATVRRIWKALSQKSKLGK